jgi:hypothetical protein
VRCEVCQGYDAEKLEHFHEAEKNIPKAAELVDQVPVILPIWFPRLLTTTRGHPQAALVNESKPLFSPRNEWMSYLETGNPMLLGAS